MHFWNKLSTAALMRLTILASLNLIMGRVVGNWLLLAHPLFFLTMVTLDLGLYAIMVYSGSLNWNLIGMMLGGLLAIVAVVMFGGIGPSTFVPDSPFLDVTRFIEWLINRVLHGRAAAASSGPPLPPYRVAGGPIVLPAAPGPRFRFALQEATPITYAVIDALGLLVIAAGYITARLLRGRSGRAGDSAPNGTT